MSINCTVQLLVYLGHVKGNRHLPPGVFAPVTREAHRPLVHFRAVLDEEESVRRARQAGLPVHLVSPGDLACFGFPMTFPPVLVVARELSRAVESRFARFEFASSEAAARPRLEDLVIVMLRVDPLVARGLALHHRSMMEGERLLKRILQEDVEREATYVRLQEFVPGLPVVGEALPSAELHRQDDNAWVEGRL